MSAGQPILQVSIDTRVDVADELFAGFSSIVSAVTVAVFIIELPAGLLTLTISVAITGAPGATLPSRQLTAPVPPGGGVVQLPELESETKVVPFGTISLSVTPLAVLGPALLTTMV